MLPRSSLDFFSAVGFSSLGLEGFSSLGLDGFSSLLTVSVALGTDAGATFLAGVASVVGLTGFLIVPLIAPLLAPSVAPFETVSTPAETVPIASSNSD